MEQSKIKEIVDLMDERKHLQAERFRKSETPCYILKQFSKAGHPHVARIEYYDNMDAWIETLSEPLR